MFKNKDVILIIAVLLLAGLIAVFLGIYSGETGETVRIMIDGREYGSYPLGEDSVIEIGNTFGYNRIVIENEEVFLQEADCPDQYCVEHKAISKTNETIVCLPHKLVVELHVQNREDDFDSIVQ